MQWLVASDTRSRLPQYLIACLASLYCMLSAAAPPLRTTPSHSCEVFCGARDQLRFAGPSSIHLLDDETLFLSAESMRNGQISLPQRLLNMAWLEDSASTRIQGGRVFSRLLQHSLSRYRELRRGKNNGDEDTSIFLLESQGLRTSLGDYQLKISDDEVKLRFRYRFDW